MFYFLYDYVFIKCFSLQWALMGSAIPSFQLRLIEIALGLILSLLDHYSLSLEK